MNEWCEIATTGGLSNKIIKQKIQKKKKKKSWLSDPVTIWGPGSSFFHGRHLPRLPATQRGQCVIYRVPEGLQIHKDNGSKYYCKYGTR